MALPTETTTSAPATTQIDVITVGAMAIVAYLIAVITHEAAGHGLAAFIVGAPITHVTSLDLVADLTKVGAWSARFVDAAGCLAQFILAGIIYTLYRHTPLAASNRRFFLWLLTFINILIPAGYLMALSFAPFGDWNDFVQGLPNQVVWRLVLTLLGTVVSVAAIFAGARGLNPYLGTETKHRMGRAFALTLTAYLVGSTANTLAGIFNPDGVILVLISAAAATFGGTICLFWTGFTAAQLQPVAGIPVVTVSRNTAWLVSGVVALIVYFFVLGPGIPR